MARLEGTFKGRGVEGSVQYGASSNGTDQIVVNLMLETGDEVSTFLYFSEKAAPHSIKRLRLLGWKGNDLSNITGIDAEEVDVRVYWEEYNGEDKMKVEIVSGGTVVLANPLDAKGKKSFAQRYANLVDSVKPETKKAAPQQRRQAPPQQRNGRPQDGGDFNDYPAGDDEIPFIADATFGRWNRP